MLKIQASKAQKFVGIFSLVSAPGITANLSTCLKRKKIQSVKYVKTFSWVVVVEIAVDS